MTFIDICSGIGGFRLGLELAGFKCIGFCEIDKFAVKSYKAMFNTEGEWFSSDITKVEHDDIPAADLWCFGFPCQDLSVAGKRKGIIGKRSSIYFKIIDILKSKKEKDKPTFLLAENVKNLLSINNGFDFVSVLSEMDKAGYDIFWQVLNSKDFGVPQNRERVFIIGNLRSRGRRKILPFKGENKSALKQIIGGKQGYRVYNSSGISCTLVGNAGGAGAKTGLYAVDLFPILTPDRKEKRQNGRRIKNKNEPMFTITSQDRHGIGIKFNNEFRIRRLTPKECFRLQGFPDDLYERASAVNSESQLYKQAGNAVTVNVAYSIAIKLKELQNLCN